MTTYKWFEIEDTRYNLCIVSGDTPDNRTYHQPPKGRSNAQWKLVPTSDGYYQIIDRLSQRAMVAGDAYPDNHVYHQDPNRRTNAEWTLVPWQAHPGQFHIMNRKWADHGIVVGDAYADNNTYFQVPGDRANAVWTLRLVVDGDVGPKQYVADEIILGVDVDLHAAHTISEDSEVIEETFRNDAGGEVTKKFDSTRERTSTFEATYEKWVSSSLALALTQSFGIKLKAVNAGVQVKLETKQEEGARWSRKSTGTVTQKIGNETTFPIPPHKTIHFKQTITEKQIDAPFQVRVRQVLGDGSKQEVTYKGRLQGIKYTLSTAELTPVE